MAKPDYIDLDNDGDKKEPMKKAAKDAKKKKTNESYQASAVGRKLQAMAEVEPNDMIANAMANLATHLEGFGGPFSAKTMQDLVKKTGMDKDIIKALINRAVKKESMSESKLVEGLADEAQRAEFDHEVQMARADLYKIAKYAIKLHDMLKGVSEAEGIEGWQQAKITKASEYISAVYHNLDYDLKFDGAGELGEAAAKIACTKCDEVSTAAAWKKNNNFCPKCKTSNQGVAEGKKKYKSAAQRKAIHANKAKNESADPYKKSLRAKLAEKAESKDQQRAAGIALKHKREGTKPPKGSASEEMMKMSTKELEKFAGTKHKGLPKDKS
jgi:phage FluMu protein Com